MAIYTRRVAAIVLFCLAFGIPLVVWELGRGGLLSWAARHGTPTLIEFLLAAGADPNQRASNDWPPLFFAAWHRNPGTVKALLAAGARVNLSYSGLTPLHCAAKGGSPEVVKTLLGAGADVNAGSAYDWTPLSEALFQLEVQADSIRRGFIKSEENPYKEIEEILRAHGGT